MPETEIQPVISAEGLIERAKEIARRYAPVNLAVAAAQDADVLQAVSQAVHEKFVTAQLIGDESAIHRLAEEHQIEIAGIEIISAADPTAAAHEAVRRASAGEADAIMKGFLPTSALLKVILDKKYGLRGPTTLSHCAVLDIPGYHKLLNFTDGGMVVKPDIEQKLQILENALMVARALGVSPIRVAVSAATDKMSERVPHTLSDRSTLIPAALEKFKDIAIQSPLSLDVATSKKAAEYQRVSGPVVGDADIYLVDSIEEGNIVSKALIQFAGAIFAGVIMGAKVPVSLVSRTDTVMNKKASIALSCVIAHYYRERGTWKERL